VTTGTEQTMDGVQGPAAGTTLTPAARRLLARRLRGRGGAAPPAEIPRRSPLPAEVPLSPAQQRLYFLDRLRPGSGEYLMPVAWRLAGPLDADALERALGDLVERHDQLRTRFPARAGRARQETLPPGAFTLEHADLTGTPESGREHAARQAVLDAATRPFELAAEAPFRATLVRLGARDHVLVLAMHHIVSDAWSAGILARDLRALYEARLAGGGPDTAGLPELPISYADYAVWSRDESARARAEADLAYWRERLAGLTPLELPADRPRPAEPSTSGAVHTLVLPASLTGGLRAAAERAGATMFMTLLAAFQVTLAFHTGRDDVAVGTVVAGRDRPRTQELVGFFAGTLVLRADLSGDPSLADHLARVRDATLAAFDHQDLPFERLVEELSPERDLRGNPLFQVLFAYETAGESGPATLALGEARGTPVPIDDVRAKFDLSLHAEESPEGLRLSFVHRDDLFERRTVAALADHLRRVLETLVAAPGTRTGDLDPLTEDERAELLAAAVPATAGMLPAAEAPPLPEEFARQAARCPGAPAVTCGNRTLTYAELDARSGALAGELRRRGVGPETRVGICMARTEEQAVAVLGVWKAGGAYVPLDPGYPAARLEFMTEDADLRLVVTDAATRATADRLGVSTLLVDAPGTPGGAVHGIRAGHAAYVIYTSGSTGTPKGVVVTHGNAARLFRAAAVHVETGPDDVWSVAHSFSFDFSVWELWGALVTGGRAVVVPAETARDPEAMAALLREERVTVLSQTPAAFQGLRAHLARTGRDAADLDLRTVFFGGDALRVSDLRDWFAGARRRLPRLVNMYGITETTVHVTYREITEADTRGAVGSPIGTPLPDLRCHVLDRHGRLVPAGVPGELYVAGAGLARGYLGRPGLTAERFLPDPYGPPGGRLYRTGDRVRRLAGGELEFLGRVDDQVKVRGFRVELGEVEAALRGCAGVTDAAVVACAGDEGATRLVAHVATADGRVPGGWREHLGARLPGHMIPAAVAGHRSLPLTANGKVDRKALAGLDVRPEGTDATRTPPRTETESVLAGIWAEALGLDGAGVEDNFFHLGGDSILALRVVGRCRDAGLAVTVPDVFRYQTLGDLARHAEKAAAPEDPGPVAPLAMVDPRDAEALPGDVVDAYPLTALQTGMLHEMLADPGRAPYHNVTSFRLSDPAGFDLGAFQAAVDTLVARHDNLRTSVDLAGYSEPLQLVHGHAALPVGFADLRETPPEERRAVVAAHVREEFARPFDLTAAPLLRLFVHRLGEEEYRLTITDCHIVLDGWSLTSFIADLTELHGAALRGAEPPAPPSSPRFADYVALERATQRSEESREFWRTQVRDLEPVHLSPAPGTLRPGERPPHEASRSFPHLREPLRRVARLAGVPVRTVFLAAYHHLMGLFAGQDAYSAGVAVNGRPERPGADRMSGLFLNTVPFGFRPAGESWAGLLRETFAAERALLPHRRYPLADIQRDSGRVVAETLFNFVDFHRLPDEVWDDSLEIARTNYALFFNTSPAGLTLDADPAYLHPAACEQLADVYRHILESIAADPYGRPEPPALSGPARDVALREWAVAPPVTGDGLMFHELVSEQARLRPDSVAVAYGDREISYAELDRATTRLAWELVRLGVGPESVVGVCLDRGPGLVTALLGVLKAGGAFLPLDPEYPADRLAFMVRDSGTRVLLTRTGLAAGLPPVEHTVRLDAPDRPPADTPERAPDTGTGPENLAYVIYTSGSTGRPKGVAVPHRGLTNAVHAQRALVEPTPGERVLQLASPSFDMSLYEIVWALANGGRLCTAARRDLLPGPDLARTVRDHGVTTLMSTPSALSVMSPGDLPSVTTLMFAGEACGAEPADAWAPGRRVFDGYGPTECSIIATVSRCPGGEGRPLIGRPVPGTEAYVLGADLRPVPVGVPGELYLGGAGVGRGYLGRPATTAERFVPDPFSGRPGARLYRTGDRVRHTPDGSIDYLGRLDDQVKLRGFRIEPGEIESALAGLPGVRVAAAVVREDRPGDRRLVAYAEPEDGVRLSEEEIREGLRGRLPAHMLPAAYVFLDALPRTGSGKIDRRALPAPARDRPGSAGRYVAPRTPAERVMAEIWAGVLGVERVGVDDDFFALGGDSLSTVRVASLARARGVPVSVRELMERPTIARLTAARDAAVAPVRHGGCEVVLRPGEGPPVYCVHPTGGHVAWYLPLARRLGGDRPVVGFQAQGLAGGVDPTTMRGIAATYAAGVAASGYGGPHTLIGWSMGANIALEMAVQLSEAGIRSDPLILVEPALKTDVGRRRLAVFAARQREALALRDRLRALPADAPERVEIQAEMRAVLLAAGMLPDEVGLEMDAPIEVWHSLLQALADEEPRRYDGPIHLVVGRETVDVPDGAPMVDGDVTYAEYLRAWEELAGGGLTVHHVPGGHRTMLTEPLVGNVVAVVESARAGAAGR
jgi:amino acid adenylation domain-containing protein